jgi:DoxX-like protein
MNSTNNISKSKKITFLITTTVIAIAYFVTGLGNILPFTHIAQNMAHLGYPIYFLKIIGTWKILAAIVVVLPNIPRIKEWAYAGMILDLTGASFSRFAVGDALPQIIIPLGIATLVTVNYLLRHSLQSHTNAVK